jgi:type II secretory pathway pseudopilin PulG
MMRLNPQRRFSQARGFLLLEAILAVSILSIIAVSLTVAIDRLGALALASQREMSMMRNLQTLLTWHLRDPNIEELLADLSAPDSYGVVYESTVEEMEIENEDGQPLPEMYRIQIRAMWQEAGLAQEEIVETYRYARLYRNS